MNQTRPEDLLAYTTEGFQNIQTAKDSLCLVSVMLTLSLTCTPTVHTFMFSFSSLYVIGYYNKEKKKQASGKKTAETITRAGKSIRDQMARQLWLLLFTNQISAC